MEDSNNQYDFSDINNLNRNNPVTTQPNRDGRISSRIQSLIEELPLISINTERYPGERRPIPVSTLDWQSTDQSQFIPVYGLDFLIGVPTIIIQQTMDLSDMSSSTEPENKYILKVPNGESLYRATEVSTPLSRLMCGSNRSFHMTLLDHTNQQALTIQRKTKFAMCCLPCIVQEVEVTVPPGEFLGCVQQEWTFGAPMFLVRNFNDDVLYVIEGPNRNICCPSMEAEFRILSGDTLTQHGTIQHGWDIQSSNFNTVITFPSMAADPKIKALLIAAGILIEYVFFVAPKSNSCMRCIC